MRGILSFPDPEAACGELEEHGATEPQIHPQRFDDDPQDAVTRAPSVDPDMTQLIGWDMHGVVRVKIEVAEKDAGWWERLMLGYMERRFGRQLRVLR